MNSFAEKSYEAHRDHWAKQNSGSLREGLKNDPANGFRHDRMLATALAFHQPGDSWLTIGDGKGTDAFFLKEHLKDARVIASDISGGLLPQAKAEGMIDHYQLENGEALSFADDGIDWVLIKEALHHFPRPYAGLYEALRVAKKGVLLIEPNDPWATNDQYFEGASFTLARRFIGKAWSQAKLSLKKALGRPYSLHYDYYFSFPGMTHEEVGNFLYTFSRRDLEKVGCALNLPSIAVKYLSDVYIGPKDPLYTTDKQELLKRVQTRVAEQEKLAQDGLWRPNILCFAFYKQGPGQSERLQAEKEGFRVVDLPKNPHL